MVNEWILEDEVEGREEETVSKAEKNDKPVHGSLG
jgi:hypothetical protein